MPDLVVQNAGKLDKKLVPNANLNAFTIKEGNSNFLRVRCEGSFIEDFELEHFPFDIQDLKMVFTLSFADASTAIFIVNKDATDFCVLTRYTALPEWEFMRLSAFSQVKENFTYATGSIIVKRKPKTYVLKLGGFSVLPNYFSLLAFTLPPDDFSGRVSICLTLVLALAAILFVLQSMLPMTSKMTWIDQLLMGSLTTVSFITALVTVSGLAGQGSPTMDLALFTLGVIAVVGHTAYFVAFSYKATELEFEKLQDPVTRYLAEEEGKPTFLWAGEVAERKKFSSGLKSFARNGSSSCGSGSNADEFVEVGIIGEKL